MLPFRKHEIEIFALFQSGWSEVLNCIANAEVPEPRKIGRMNVHMLLLQSDGITLTCLPHGGHASVVHLCHDSVLTVQWNSPRIVLILCECFIN